MLLEVWFDEVYTRGFYVPAAGDVVIDAGANIGLFSLWIARHCRQCRVLALEPLEENYALLVEKLAAADANNVKPLLAAISGESGAGAIVEVGQRSQDHRLTPANAEATNTVRTLSFADTLAMAEEATIALFKCDIEGSEFDVFNRAEPGHLRHVLRFAIEYHDNVRPGTLPLLERRLGPTHNIAVHKEGDYGYGMLYATLKGLT
jgi:FkbM family methyltransferase